MDSDEEAELAAAVGRLAPTEGVMLQAVWFAAGSGRAGRLLLVAHHLVVDGVSWRIIASDLAAAARGEQLPPVGTSLRGWARGLVAAAVDREHELPFWLSTLERTQPPLMNAEATRELKHHSLRLSAERTRPLLTTVPDAFHAGVQDVLLAALAFALRQWRPETTADGVLLRLEGHGREEQLVPGSDLARTVGWFTTEYPVRLDPGDAGPAEALKRIKEQLREVPDGGAGYGLLRYLNPRTADRLAGGPTPEILFNYLGRLAASADTDWAAVADGAELDPELPVAHALEINASTIDLTTGPELDIRLSYLGGSDVARLGELWVAALAALASGPGGGGHTPSDLSLVALSQDEIDEFEDEWRLS